MADNVVFLEPGDERAQKIAKAMGSQTASDILHILGDGPRSLTDITEKLNIPMNTAKYHVENMLDAGLIAVEKTRYSIKGREVKIYTLTNQLLVVAPRQSDARSIFLKYASLFGIVALAAVLISVFAPLFGGGSMLSGSANAVAPQYSATPEAAAVARATGEIIAENGSRAPEGVLTATKGVADTMTANISPAALSTPSPAMTLSPQPFPTAGFEQGAGAVVPGIDPALAFFLGGMLVIFVLLCYEAWLWRKHYR